ncbi:hypothetical protein C8F04DRAFT_1197754 [Mycena alexandri]|uniref:Uncharacterized protein n=1 Tax=Mycena alexandri TaxID=1745969 RepID=A0AAD6WSK1_9AGAR|nr:hypothetical protein C8F04DRAFT_1197754 [Mycena alexandri]
MLLLRPSEKQGSPGIAGTRQRILPLTSRHHLPASPPLSLLLPSTQATLRYVFALGAKLTKYLGVFPTRCSLCLAQSLVPPTAQKLRPQRAGNIRLHVGMKRSEEWYLSYLNLTPSNVLSTCVVRRSVFSAKMLLTFNAASSPFPDSFFSPSTCAHISQALRPTGLAQGLRTIAATSGARVDVYGPTQEFGRALTKREEQRSVEWEWEGSGNGRASMYY